MHEDGTRKPGAYRVLLVNDQPESLQLMRALLDGHASIKVVAEAIGSEHALSLLRTVTPQVAVVDVQMPNVHGIEAARRLRAADPNLRVVMVSDSRDPQYPALARAAGAAGFIPKGELSAATLMQILDS